MSILRFAPDGDEGGCESGQQRLLKGPTGKVEGPDSLGAFNDKNGLELMAIC
jgi:hypothetical protein